MKITLKNTRALYYLSLINIIACAIMFRSLYINDRGFLLQSLILWLCLSYAFILIYFVRILLFFVEKTAVIAAYSMFTGILVINMVAIFFPHLLKEDYVTWLETLTLAISLLAAFRSFFVKAAPVKYAFMIFGGGIALLTLPRLFVLFVATVLNEAVISITADLGSLIVLFGSCFILKSLLNFLKSGGERPAEALIETEPGPLDEE